jgi:hypothetical protein
VESERARLIFFQWNSRAALDQKQSKCKTVAEMRGGAPDALREGHESRISGQQGTGDSGWEGRKSGGSARRGAESKDKRVGGV